MKTKLSRQAIKVRNVESRLGSITDTLDEHVLRLYDYCRANANNLDSGAVTKRLRALVIDAACMLIDGEIITKASHSDEFVRTRERIKNADKKKVKASNFDSEDD